MGRLRLRRLGNADLAAVERHLLGLDATDRASRFRTPLGDGAISAYARGLDPRRTILVGACDAGTLVGLAEAHADGPGVVEIAVSVDAARRCRGLARALVARAIRLAATAGAVVAELHFTPGHAAIAGLARALGGAADCCRGHATIALAGGRRHAPPCRGSLTRVSSAAPITNITRIVAMPARCVPNTSVAVPNRNGPRNAVTLPVSA